MRLEKSIEMLTPFYDFLGYLGAENILLLGFLHFESFVSVYTTVDFKLSQKFNLNVVQVHCD